MQMKTKQFVIQLALFGILTSIMMNTENGLTPCVRDVEIPIIRISYIIAYFLRQAYVRSYTSQIWISSISTLIGGVEIKNGQLLGLSVILYVESITSISGHP